MTPSSGRHRASTNVAQAQLEVLDAAEKDTRTAANPAAADARTALAGGSMARGVATSAGWSAFGRMGSQGLQFVTGLALARLLMPEDFGLLASVYVITGLTVIFFDMGLTAALVHHRDLDDRTMSTAFWMNAIGGVVFVGLLAAAGPAVADFFHDDRLRLITPLAGLPFTLSLTVVPSALLQRRLAFKPLSLAEVASAIVANLTTVTGALLGMGPYALVAGPIMQSVVLTAILWSMQPWRPRSFISARAARDIWRFSGGVLGFAVVNYAGRNSDNLLIGRLFGPGELGYYNRAYNLMLLPLQQVGGVLGRVMFPALTAMGDDLDRVRSAYRRVLRLITVGTMPVLVGMAASAPALVGVLWGSRWAPSVPLLQLLCLAGLPQCLSSSGGWLYQSQGRTKLMFYMGIAGTVVTVTGIAIGVQWGALGVAWAVLATKYLFLPFDLGVACSTIGLAARRVYRDNATTFSVALGMGACVWALPLLLGTPRDTGWLLPLQVGLGVLLYVGALRILSPGLLREARTLRRSRHP